MVTIFVLHSFSCLNDRKVARTSCAAQPERKPKWRPFFMETATHSDSLAARSTCRRTLTSTEICRITVIILNKFLEMVRVPLVMMLVGDMRLKVFDHAVEKFGGAQVTILDRVV